MINSNKGTEIKIAIITEFLYFTGGIEKCILALHNELTSRGVKVDIYAGIYAPEKTFKEFKELNVKFFLKEKLSPIINTFYLRRKFRNLKLPGYDGYIIFGSHSIAAGKNNHPNIWWSTRPLAYLYGDKGKIPHEFLEYMYRKNKAKKIALQPYFSLLKMIDQKDIKNVDKLMVVGPLAEQWLAKAYPQRKIEVLYQPVEISRYKYLTKGTYYLNVARHVTDKHVERVIEAFKKMPDKVLYQVGEGPDTEKMKALAKGAKNIHLLGFLKEDELPKVIGKSIAMISAAENEDYSMNLIESVSSGKPTISVNLNRAVKEIVKTETGILMPNSQPDSIMRAVKMLDVKTAQKMRTACEKRSVIFSNKNYADTFLKNLAISS